MGADPVTNLANQQEIFISLYDTETLIDDNDEPSVIDLELADNPIRRGAVDSDEDKFKPVKPKEVEIAIHSGNVGLSTFSVGGERRWRVEIDVNVIGRNIFKGFVSPSDISVNFLPDPNEIILIATCGLSSLRDIPLTDLDGDVPLNEHRIADIITWCLSKTGLSLQLCAIMNLRHGTGSYTANVDFSANLANLPAETTFFYPGQKVRISGTASNNGTFTVRGDLSFINFDIITFEETFVTELNVNATFQDISSEAHFYDDQFLNVKSFEGQEFGECENCYDVLEKILGEDCFLTQWKGRWYILRVDEMDGNDYYRALFNTDGSFEEFLPVLNYTKEIGVGDEMSWMNDDAVVTMERPFGEIVETFMFKYWRELVANGEFIRGDVTDDSDPLEKEYTLDDWTLYKELPNTTPIDNTHFIKREFDEFANEISRYAAIGIGGSDVIYYAESCKFPIGAKDRLRFSLGVKWNGQVETSAGLFRRNIAQIRLYADDDTHYTLHGGNSIDEPLEWRLSNSDWSSNNAYIHLELDGADDDTEWRTVSFWDGVEASPEVPKNGYISILLHHQTKPDEFEIHFQDLRVTHIAYINGSHARYTGQENKVSNDNKSKRSEQVHIANAPSKLFKGALQRLHKYVFYYDDLVTFGAPDGFTLPGNRVNHFPKGKRLRINGPTQDGFCQVVSATYNIVGDTTAIVVTGMAITTVIEKAEIAEAVYILSRGFYAANVLPSGPTSLDQVHPFGYLQAFSVWNQFNRYMRKFEGDVDHIPLDTLDSIGDVDIPDLLHKYYLTDPSEDTVNKYFQLLHFSQNLFLCESEKYFHEVYDTAEGKVYDDDHRFRYITGENE
jgi:hypothetical protein